MTNYDKLPLLKLQEVVVKEFAGAINDISKTIAMINRTLKEQFLFNPESFKSARTIYEVQREQLQQCAKIIERLDLKQIPDTEAQLLREVLINNLMMLQQMRASIPKS